MPFVTAEIWLAILPAPFSGQVTRWHFIGGHLFVWYGMVCLLCYGMVWWSSACYVMVWYGMVWLSSACYGMVWFVCYGTVWSACYGMVCLLWYGMVWWSSVDQRDANCGGQSNGAQKISNCCRQNIFSAEMSVNIFTADS